MDNKQIYTIDTVPTNRFHKKIAAYTLGGSFIDGYILGIIEFALLLIVPYMDMSSSWQGLIGSSPLIGVFIGSLIFGVLSDKIGRQRIYTLNFVVVVIASILQFFVNTPAPLFILRLILGIAIGAEYAIGPALIAEFTPVKLRGQILAMLNVSWTVGYVGAAFAGYAMTGLGESSWRWMLASSAVFAVIVLVIRIGMPESPRWLILHGQIEKAKEVTRRYIGENVSIDEMIERKEEQIVDKGYKHLFINGMWKKTMFCAIIWLSGVIPLFGIFTFLPTVLDAVGIEDEGTGSMLVNIAMLIGAIVAVFIIDRFSRKGLCVWTLLISGIPLFVLGIWSGMNGILVVIMFCVFIFFAVIAGSLSGFVYPSEVFPTEIRSSGIGFCSAVSRIGSAAGTFLVPVLIDSAGIGVVLIGMGAFQLLAVIVTIAWAPETRQAKLK
ncbi:MAG: MFS transporter [Lentihominibacter sp.]